MSTESLLCWKCGASLDEVPMPLSRLAECLSCRAELHVCRMCRFYNVSLAQDCSEPMAEEVKDKGRANFCEYFEPDPDAFDPSAPGRGESSTAALDALFGGPAESPSTGDDADAGRKALDDLFGPPTGDRD